MFGPPQESGEHDPTKWLSWFKEACEKRATHPPRAEIIRQTGECLRKGTYPYKGVEVTLKELMGRGPSGSVRRKPGEGEGIPVERSGKPVKVTVVNMDCVKAAMKVMEETGSAPVLLNMAAPHAPGVGPHGAQEENLHRRSNLKMCTIGRSDLYPIPRGGCLYHPDVVFFRGAEDEGYPFLEVPVLIPVVSAAALRLRPIETWTEEHEATTEETVTSIFATAAEFKHKNIVLSALGCGAFHNPPPVVAKIFKKVLSEKFPDSFENVVFAIIEDHNSKGVNGKVFSGVFGVELE
eukprot:TRINITY_DN27526_c0_g1_i1.p1 TRINITY_DN27526_c0_g1~~TRINITY_DN27526_c0_g1_i1.p1  ORF type:complete len:305 (+),score=69.50 TRINITY_DN27526_c0_g1_i1:39-917(+)